MYLNYFLDFLKNLKIICNKISCLIRMQKGNFRI